MAQGPISGRYGDSPLNTDYPLKAVRVPPDRFKRNLTQKVELTRQHGARAVLLSFAGDPGLGENPYAHAIGEVGKELEVLVVVYKGPRIDIVHPNAKGYAWLADQILVRLDDGGYLEPGPRRTANAPRT